MQLLTISNLNMSSLEAEQIGQKQKMLWNICPTNTVVPILHCEIGTANDQLFKKLFRQLLSIECGTQEELDKELRILELNEIVDEMKTRKQVLESHLDLQLTVHNSRRKALVARRGVSTRKLKTAQQSSLPNSILRINDHTADLHRINHMINTIDTAKSSISLNIKRLSASLQLHSKTVSKLQAEIKELSWERRKEEVSIFTKVERILEQHGVKIQAYHGGTLTGVAIIALLNNRQSIMHAITCVAFTAIARRSNDNLPLRPPTISEFTKILNLHQKLFQAQDAVYAHLRLINPTQIEKLRQEKE